MHQKGFDGKVLAENCLCYKLVAKLNGQIQRQTYEWLEKFWMKKYIGWVWSGLGLNDHLKSGVAFS